MRGREARGVWSEVASSSPTRVGPKGPYARAFCQNMHHGQKACTNGEGEAASPARLASRQRRGVPRRAGGARPRVRRSALGGRHLGTAQLGQSAKHRRHAVQSPGAREVRLKNQQPRQEGWALGLRRLEPHRRIERDGGFGFGSFKRATEKGETLGSNPGRNR